ncbi:MAG: WecB/TagA/CpsF family glycosyltransferase [Candidatus Eremiobacteraeota bacterium]|nr:WecB/TagA/CpsF family glycosyltransferase [Candidatus Eremiobacteraeota bacterium]MBV8333150.1 WecB/TagA/CpsF family glycosyltransferase [Candidatus Eremiobacteraeota bacterium]MBV8434628.1 WecB/TagA/CpsF family glycosyltransferase [Candidatus Eremiobacteraeota bacterium]
MEILGCRLDPIDETEAAARIVQLAREGAGAQVVTLGTEMVVHAQRDERFRAIVNASALSLCDTVGLLTVARRRGAELGERVTGVELTGDLCARAAREGLPVYFLGGAPGVAADAAAILEVQHPGLQIAGARDGYFRDDEAPEVAAAIRESGAKLLFVGMGFPRQEYFLADYVRESGCGAGIGVGGSFDVISGRVDRAPPLFRKFGLEWLYRLIKEPQRWRRQLALPYFVWLVGLEEIGLRKSARASAASGGG